MRNATQATGLPCSPLKKLCIKLATLNSPFTVKGWFKTKIIAKKPRAAWRRPELALRCDDNMAAVPLECWKWTPLKIIN
jgi:hypothetical protein